MAATSPIASRPAAAQHVPGFSTQFSQGLSDLWRGLRLLISRPSLWPWAVIPFVLNIVLLGGLIWLGWHFVGDWISATLLAPDSWWREALGWLLGVLYWLALGLVVLFLFVPLASLIAAPFNDLLSEQVERIVAGGTVDEKFSLRQLMRGLMIGLKTTIRLTTLTLGLLVLTLPLYLIPLIGPPLASALQTLITIRFLALEYTSYSMDRRYYTYAQRRDFLRVFRGRTWGLGVMAFCCMLVPVVNALFIPVSAIAGTLLFCETELARGRGLAES